MLVSTMVLLDMALANPKSQSLTTRLRPDEVVLGFHVAVDDALSGGSARSTSCLAMANLLEGTGLDLEELALRELGDDAKSALVSNESTMPMMLSCLSPRRISISAQGLDVLSLAVLRDESWR